MSKNSRDIELFIVDIFVALEKIRQYSINFEDADAFRHSSLHWDASIRQLEILGESLNHLLDQDMKRIICQIDISVAIKSVLDEPFDESIKQMLRSLL